jgi:two-component system, cell cycle sensor histidine kinase and response regulator CckA
MPNPETMARTVLVVDDEETELSLMGRIVQREGFAVLKASSCKEARAVFERNRDVIELMVVDISLPDGNGFELTIGLRRQNPGLRVLFVSGHVGAEVRRFYGPEIQDFQFLAKPFTSGQLAAAVLSTLKRTDYPNGSARFA